MGGSIVVEIIGGPPFVGGRILVICCRDQGGVGGGDVRDDVGPAMRTNDLPLCFGDCRVKGI